MFRLFYFALAPRLALLTVLSEEQKEVRFTSYQVFALTHLVKPGLVHRLWGHCSKSRFPSIRLRHSGQVFLPGVIIDMMEISACAGTIYIVEAEFCICYLLTVCTSHIKFNQEVFDGAIVHLERSSSAVVVAGAGIENMRVVGGCEGEGAALEQ